MVLRLKRLRASGSCAQRAKVAEDTRSHVRPELVPGRARRRGREAFSAPKRF